MAKCSQRMCIYELHLHCVQVHNKQYNMLVKYDIKIHMHHAVNVHLQTRNLIETDTTITVITC